MTYLGIGIMFNSKAPKVEELRRIVARNGLDLRRQHTSGDRINISSKL
jgi:hypothetical protein